MDDYYAACQKKIKNADDPVSAINELMALSLQDLPKLQLCKFAEQTVTLLSLYFQSTACPTLESQAKFQLIRQKLERALDGMEQIMEANLEFPPPPQSGEGCWW